MKREFQRISDRKMLYMLMIILPILLFFLFATIYKNRAVIDIPIAICDMDNSEMSRLVTRSLESTRSLKITQYSNSIDDIKQEMLRGHIQCGVYIPKGLSRDIKYGKPVSITVYKNTFNIIYGNSILRDAVTTIRTISAGILLKKFRSQGMGEDQAIALANPIRVETNSLFNPSYNYENFLVPGLLLVILQMVIMIVAVIVISSEYAEGTIPELFKLAHYKSTSVLLGKSIPHIAVHFATAMGIFGILFPLFEIPFDGSMLFGILFTFYFIIVSFFMGFFISCIFRDLFVATEVAVFINTPAFIFSGYTFPLWGMPKFHSIYAQIIPFTHFLNGFLKLYQYNAPVHYLLPEIGILSIFLAGSVILSLLFLFFKGRHLAMSEGQMNRSTR